MPLPTVAPTASCRVSVMIKAYNHERTVAQAIDSALAQRTAFPVEILVGEDCSHDRTREIVMGYAERYPRQLRVMAHRENLGMVRNTLTLYAACRGDYVAWLDGDDYWISADKLQRQVDFMDAHPEYTLCFHDALVIAPDGSGRLETLALPNQSTYTLEDLLYMPPGRSCSCMFRRVLDRFPPWMEKLSFSDWPLQVLHAEKGLAAWLPDMLAAYRESGASLVTRGFRPGGRETVQEFWLGHQRQAYEMLNRHFQFRYDDAIRIALRKHELAVALSAWVPSRILQALRARRAPARFLKAAAISLAARLPWR